MHKTFSEPPGTCFGGTGYPITRNNLAIVFPYGVPGSYRTQDVLERLLGRKIAEPKPSHVSRVLRLLGRATDAPEEGPTDAGPTRPRPARRRGKGTAAKG